MYTKNEDEKGDRVTESMGELKIKASFMKFWVYICMNISCFAEKLNCMASLNQAYLPAVPSENDFLCQKQFFCTGDCQFQYHLFTLFFFFL